MKYYSAEKMSQLQLYATIWMNLSNIMLSTKKEKINFQITYSMISFFKKFKYN